MSKVQTLSGQQRLRQLAKRQLGSDLTPSKIQTAAVTPPPEGTAANGNFNVELPSDQRNNCFPDRSRPWKPVLK